MHTTSIYAFTHVVKCYFFVIHLGMKKPQQEELLQQPEKIERTRFTTTIRPDILKAAQHRAIEEDRSVNRIIEDSLSIYLAIPKTKK